MKKEEYLHCKLQEKLHSFENSLAGAMQMKIVVKLVIVVLPITGTLAAGGNTPLIEQQGIVHTHDDFPLYLWHVSRGVRKPVYLEGLYRAQNKGPAVVM